MRYSINAPGNSVMVWLQEAVKVMAKSLVRNRHAVTKMYGLKSQLQAVSLRIAVRALTTLRTGSCMLGLLPGTHQITQHPPSWFAVGMLVAPESSHLAATLHVLHCAWLWQVFADVLP